MGERRFLTLVGGLSPGAGWWAATAKARADAASKPLEGDAAIRYFDSI